MNKARLEAFTDAIIAIAATIMVLELKVPAQATLQGLLSEWQVLLAYVISFIFIYVVWFSHHNIFKKAKTITARTFIYNGIWLFLLTLVPFTTRWVGSNVNATFPEFLYVLVLLLWSITSTGRSSATTLTCLRTQPTAATTGWRCTVALCLP